MASHSGALSAPLPFAGLALVVLVGTAGPGVAQQSDTLRMSEVVAEARQANPGLMAARHQAEAARQRVAPASALPDPMLSFGFMNRPVGGLTRTDVQMTMNTVQLSQRFPWPGARGFSGERQAHLALADAFEADELEGSLIARVKTAYYRMAYMDRAIAILFGTRELLRDFLEVAEARYAVGTGVQQDVLQAQVAIAQTSADVTVMEQDRLALAARFNSLLGRPATTAVGALELPDPRDGLPGVEEMLGVAAANRPAFEAARRRALAAESAYGLADRSRYPDITVTIAYGQRPAFADLATLMVGVDLPVFSGSKQSRVRDEMLALQSVEAAREVDLYNETHAQLAELRARAERARTLSELYRTSILPQASAAVESSLSAYRVGSVDYMTLLSNQMTVNRFLVERVRLAAEHAQTLAEIDALLGANRGELP